MAAAKPRLPAKKDVARKLLDRGSMFVHLDPRKRAVIVPPDFRDQPQLVLQIGTNLPLPIRDLRVDASGVYGTLSFNRSPFTCTVPWTAVFALVGDDGRGTVWPGSMPKEIAAEVAREAERARIAAEQQGGGDLRQQRPTRPRSATDGKRKLPPYLRVVK